MNAPQRVMVRTRDQRIRQGVFSARANWRRKYKLNLISQDQPNVEESMKTLGFYKDCTETAADTKRLKDYAIVVLS